MAVDVEEEAVTRTQSKFLVNQRVEVRKSEEGLLGSWHSGTVIACKNTLILVQYDNLQLEEEDDDDDDSEYLIEGVDASSLIDGTASTRGWIRPVPPPVENFKVEHNLHYGLCVDVFRDQAWWEGVIFDHDDGFLDRTIFFPDMGDESKAHISDLRITLDWDENSRVWNPRGNWLFLEILEEIKKQWGQLLVSVKQIWYDIQVYKDFQNLKVWTCSLYEIWKDLILRAIIDTFKLGLEELNSSENLFPEINDVDALYKHKAYFGDSLGSIPLEITGQLNNDEEIDRDDVASDMGKGTNYETAIQKIGRTWLPDCRSITPEFCQDSVVEYYKISKSGRNPSKELALKVKKHIKSLGWKIEFYQDKRGCRWRYIRPDDSVGKCIFDSLVTVCEFLRKSASGIGKRGMKRKSVVENLESRSLKSLKKGKKLKGVEIIGSEDNFTGGEYVKVQGTRKRGRKSKRINALYNAAKSSNSLEKEKDCQEKVEEIEESIDDNLSEGQLENMEVQGIKKHGTKRKISSPNFTSKSSESLNKLTSPIPTRVLRSSKSARQEVVSASPSNKSQTVISLLIDNNVIFPGTKVEYCGKDGRKMAEGQLTRNGIKCSCCQDVLSISKFEAHAGSTCHRPSANIFLEDGRSLLACHFQFKNSSRKPCEVKDDNRNDYICSVCRCEGDLILCDRCPSSFHTYCLGMKDVPEGDWFCPPCCCKICGKSKINGNKEEQSMDNSVIKCHQCELQYHTNCLKKKGHMLDSYPKGHWLCSKRCDQISSGLQKLLGKRVPLGKDNLTWTLLKNTKPNSCDHANEDSAKYYKKLKLALEVMHECFDPVVEHSTQRDIVDDVIYNRRSNLNRLNFMGFYTVVLEKDDEPASVATLRIYGEKVAELPLVATRFRYRQQGMCRFLVNELEKTLTELGVQRLVLPSISTTLDTWVSAFGFSEMTESERLNYLDYTFLDFPGTTLCQKVLPLRKSINKDLDVGSPISEVVQADRIEGIQISNLAVQLDFP